MKPLTHQHIFTLGIEEEFDIIDPVTRELRSHIQEILEDGKVTLKEQVKPEMHQSMVELGTEICSDTVMRGSTLSNCAANWPPLRHATA